MHVTSMHVSYTMLLLHVKMLQLLSSFDLPMHWFINEWDSLCSSENDHFKILFVTKFCCYFELLYQHELNRKVYTESRKWLTVFTTKGFCLWTFIIFLFLTDCPFPKFTGVQPKSFTAVEGYNTILKYSFDGYYQLSSPLRIWALLPHSQTPVWLDEFYYSGCGCWVKHQLVCSVGINPNDCCRFELIVHSIPHVNESGTVFSSTNNFTDKTAAWMCKYMTRIV